MRPRIGGIDNIVGMLAHTILANERIKQAMRVMHVIETEAALDAKPVLVRGAIAAAYVKELILLDMISELAADAAVRAHAVHLAIGKLGADVRFIDESRRHERAGWTGLYAFPAGDAGRRSHRV